jgi:hypothetical protein
MDKIPAEVKPYIEALRSLVQTGVHASPSLERSLLIKLPVVDLEVEAGASLARRADAFITILERVIEQRLDGKLRETASRLFALGEWAGVTQRERYLKAAKLHDPRWKWENYRKEPLTTLLFSVYMSLCRECERLKANSISNQDVEAIQPRDAAVSGNYLISKFEVIYNFPKKPGAPRELLELREIKALGDGVKSWQQSLKHWDDSDEMPAVLFFGSGIFSIGRNKQMRDLEPSRAYIQEVYFVKPLNKNEIAKFAIAKVETVPFENLVRESGYQDYWGLGSISTPIVSATFSVRFPEGHRPTRAWHYEDLPSWLAPGAANTSNMVEIDKSNFATASWSDLKVGFSYGLAWEW